MVAVTSGDGLVPAPLSLMLILRGLPFSALAVKSVLIAADPYWVADYSSESTPGKVVFTIDAAGGPVVAAAIADARRAAGPGWTTGTTTAPPTARFDPRMFVPSPDGHVRG